MTLTHSQMASALEVIFPEGGWSLRDREIVSLPNGAKSPTDPELEAAWEEWERRQRRPHAVVSVTPRQFRLALVRSGISLAKVELALAGHAEALIEWEYASEVRRDHPMVGRLAKAWEKSEAELDGLFALAASL